MKKDYLRIISEYLGIFPVRINSNLVSAQNRDRWYWTNIRTKETGLFNELWSDISQPKNKAILLKDILQSKDEIDKKYFLSNIDKYDLSQIIPGGFVSDRLKLKNKDRAVCLDANYFKGIANHQERTGVCVAMQGRNPENPSDRRTGSPTEQRLEAKIDGKTNCITSVSKDNLILQKARGFNKGGIFESKSPSLTSNSWDQNNHLQQNYKLRRLTPIECERLQTVPDNYTSCVSDTQRYKMLGNGWTIDIIAHIFSFI